MMRLTADSLERWARRTEVVALAALAWTVLVPVGVVWTAAVGATLIGFAVVAAVLVHRSAVPSLTAAIATARRPGASRPARWSVDGGE